MDNRAEIVLLGRDENEGGTRIVIEIAKGIRIKLVVRFLVHLHSIGVLDPLEAIKPILLVVNNIDEKHAVSE